MLCQKEMDFLKQNVNFLTKVFFFDESGFFDKSGYQGDQTKTFDKNG